MIHLTRTIRGLALVPLVCAVVLVPGCAGPAKLAERSEQKLVGGDPMRAWSLATKALDKEPGNRRAQDAALAAATAIGTDWRRRIRALADADTIQAADQVLAFRDFRVGAARYATVPVDSAWTGTERALCRAAARVHYEFATAALQGSRPKQAWVGLQEVQRYVPGYRDAARLSAKAYEQALTRVAVVPFGVASPRGTLGRDVSDSWRDGLSQAVAPPAARFTRVLLGGDVARAMTVSELDQPSREKAVRVAGRAGAERLVWGWIGGVDTDTRTDTFRDVVSRRVKHEDDQGHEVVEWVDVPILVVARLRTVTVDLRTELISTATGATLAHHEDRPTVTARALWTTYLPEGDLDDYALVSESRRHADPERAKKVEERWHAVAGEGTSLRQVFEARRSTRETPHYRRESLRDFVPGARRFVFLEELPPADDLALAALVDAWGPLRDDLLRLDGVDEVDVGLPDD